MIESEKKNKGLRRLWIASAWLFVIAAAAGIAFRWGMFAGFPEGWNLRYIRHGHSHLMLMGWATPALMALMAARWPRFGGRSADRSVCVMGWTAWVLALVSFPAFLVYGYESVAIGSANLPIAAILSGLAMLAWYGFAVVYFRANKGVPRSPAHRLWDLAVAALVVSSIGAWAVAGLMMGGIDSILWESVTVHFFVDLFGGGWLILGTLGVLRSYIAIEDSANERFGRILVGVAVAFVFLVTVPRAYAPEAWPLIGSAAAGMVAAGLILIVQRMWSVADLWSRRVLLLLALKIAMLASVAVPPLADWGLAAGLRILYLHLAFVGVVTLGLVVTAHREWGGAAVGSRRAWFVGSLVLLGSMVPLTGLWPRQMAGAWTVDLAFFGSVVATLAVLIACGMGVAKSLRMAQFSGKNCRG